MTRVECALSKREALQERMDQRWVHSLVEGLFPRKEGFIHLVECFFKIKPTLIIKSWRNVGSEQVLICVGGLL